MRRLDTFLIHLRGCLFVALLILRSGAFAPSSDAVPFDAALKEMRIFRLGEAKECPSFLFLSAGLNPGDSAEAGPGYETAP
jgi:hypothetical protein